MHPKPPNLLNFIRTAPIAELHKLLILSVLMLSGASAYGAPQIYLSKEQALKLVCGEEAEALYSPQAISKSTHEILGNEDLDDSDSDTANFFICSKAGNVSAYALIDSEVGKHMPITYIVGLTPRGEITRVEVMVFRETIGWEVKERSFMKQFEGKSIDADLRIGSEIKHVTGATLSSRAMSKGVRRALILWRTFFGAS